MRYWLLKCEPSEYSIDDLKRDKRYFWDGIRNYQVRNLLRDDMRAGDKALFYQSSAALIGVVGEMEIANAAAPDPTQFDSESKYFDPKSDSHAPRWFGVEVRFVQKFPQLISLTELKQQTKLADLPLLRRGNRLSVMELTKAQFTHIVHMAARK